MLPTKLIQKVDSNDVYNTDVVWHLLLLGLTLKILCHCMHKSVCRIITTLHANCVSSRYKWPVIDTVGHLCLHTCSLCMWLKDFLKHTGVIKMSSILLSVSDVICFIGILYFKYMESLTLVVSFQMSKTFKMVSLSMSELCRKNNHWTNSISA